jgi:hypothetical protein
MKTTSRAAVAALALAAFVAQPIAANAGVYVCPPAVPAVPAGPHNVGALPIFWAVGFFLCAGMTIGKQDKDAKDNGTTVSHKDRAHGFLGCLIPPIGLAKLAHHDAVSVGG